MDSLIIYWTFYISSITGLHNSSGVLLITEDSIKTYIPEYGYVNFKIEYTALSSNSGWFQIIASREGVILSLLADSKKIEQTIIIADLNYVERVAFQVVKPPKKKRKRK